MSQYLFGFGLMLLVLGNAIYYLYTEANWKLVAIYQRAEEGIHIVKDADGGEHSAIKLAGDTTPYAKGMYINVYWYTNGPRVRFYLGGPSHNREIQFAMYIGTLGILIMAIAWNYM